MNLPVLVMMLVLISPGAGMLWMAREPSEAPDRCMILGVDADGDGVDDFLRGIPLNNVTLVVFYEHPVTEKDLGALSKGLEVEHVYRYLDAARVRGSGLEQDDLSALADLPGVARVSMCSDAKAFLDVSVPNIRARGSSVYSPNTAWELGITGRGSVVAITDTGVDDIIHESLRGKFVAGADFSGLISINNSNPDDGNGHGTHCASIAVGDGGATHEYSGVAPNASLIDLKIATAIGESVGNLDDALEWCISNHATYNLSVISISFGGTYSSNGQDSTSLLVNRAVDEGIIVCVAIGNDGTNTVPSPAAADKAITVGATVDQNTVTRSDDVIAWYSNFGLRPSDGDSDQLDEMKPEICAPGTDIMAAMYNTYNAYVSKSGTSMACPHVAGICALMKEARPSLTPDEAKMMLKRTAEQRGSSDAPSVDPKYDQQYGWGIVDAYGAVKTLLDLGNGTFTGPANISPFETGMFAVSMPYTRTTYISQKDSLRFTVSIPGTWTKPSSIDLDGGQGITVSTGYTAPALEGGQWVFEAYFNYTGTTPSDTLVAPKVTFRSQAPQAQQAYGMTADFDLGGISGSPATHTVAVGATGQGDLYIGDMTFSNSIPDQGEQISIYASVNNTGYSDVSGVKVEFSDGPPNSGRLISSQSVNIPARNHTIVEAKWTTTPGEHNIFVVVDPDNKVPESNEQNNTASRRIFVKGFNPAPMAVLSAEPTDINVEETVQFDGSDSYDTNLDGSGTINYYYFDFGDGANSGWMTYSNTTHAYAAPGTFQAALSVKDNGGVESANDARVQINVTAVTFSQRHLYLRDGDGMSEETASQQGSKPCPSGVGQGGIGVIAWMEVGQWNTTGDKSTHDMFDKIDFKAYLSNTGTQRIRDGALEFTLYLDGTQITATEVISQVQDLNTSETKAFTATYTLGDSVEVKFKHVLRLDIRCRVDGDGVVLLYGGKDTPSEVGYRYTVPQMSPPAVDAGADKAAEVLDILEFSANVSDPDGAIYNYTWDFGDGEYYRSADSPNTTHAYQTPGGYQAKLSVYDDDGLMTQDIVGVTIRAENTAPGVSIVNPASHDTISGMVNVSGTATDAEGLAGVEVKVDSNEWEAATGLSNWFYHWDSGKVADGKHTIEARAFDGELYSQAASIQVTTFNTPYAPEVGSPVANPQKALRGLDVVVFSAGVSDGNGASDIVLVSLDLSPLGQGTLPMYDNGDGSDKDKGDGVYTCSFFIPEDAPTGTYELTMTAKDRTDRTGSATVSLQIADPNPSPKVGSVDISPRSVANGGSILITAEVSDPDGASDIKAVTCDVSPLGGSERQELYDDGTNGDDKAGDGIYSISFTVSKDAGEGVQAIPVRAEDKEGNSGSGEAEVTVESSSVAKADTGLNMIYVYIGAVSLIAVILVVVILFVATRPKKSGTGGKKAKPVGRTAKRHDEAVVRVQIEEPDDFDVYEAAVVEE